MASMLYEPPPRAQVKYAMTWQRCVERISTRNPEGRIDVPRAVLFTLLCTPLVPFDALVYVFGMFMDWIPGIFGGDMRYAKTWFALWYVMFGTRTPKKPLGARGWEEEMGECDPFR
jgi:hypothetical protein